VEKEVGQGKIPVADVVGRVLLDQFRKGIPGLLVIPDDGDVVAAEGPVPLTIGHPIESLQCFLKGLVRLVDLFQVVVGRPHARVGAPEFRIRGDSLGVRLQRLLAPALGGELLGARIGLHGSQRGGRECLRAGQVRGLRFRFTEERADAGGDGVHRLQNALTRR
jgi:hypothetical protein